MPLVPADASNATIDGAFSGPSGLFEGKGADLANLRDRCSPGAGHTGKGDLPSVHPVDRTAEPFCPLLAHPVTG